MSGSSVSQICLRSSQGSSKAVPCLGNALLRAGTGGLALLRRGCASALGTAALGVPVLEGLSLLLLLLDLQAGSPKPPAQVAQ